MIRFPIRADSPVEHAPAGGLPPACDVAIIGGGIAGVMTAFWLARRGVKVVLLEKGRVAGEQSSRNWGWVRQQGRDAAELPIMMEAMRLWQGLSAEFGEGLGFRQTGVSYIGNTPADVDALEAWLPIAAAHGLDSRMLSAAALRRIMPNAPGWAGALHTASDARAEPFTAVPILARGAVASGAVIVENCAVRGLDLAAGRVAGVITEQGRIACERVLLAGGAWSGLFARAHGLHLPQLSVRSSVAATQVLPEVLQGAAIEARVAFRRRADGRYTLAAAAGHDLFLGPDAFRHLRAYLPQLRADPTGTRYLAAAPKGYPDGWATPRRPVLDRPGPFEAIRVLNPAPNPRLLERARRAFEESFPTLGPIRVELAWAGMIDTMPDVVPVLDAAESLPGLFIATGLSGHGFGIGPGIGRVMADLVEGRDPGHDLRRFRLKRFTDGAPIRLAPTI